MGAHLRSTNARSAEGPSMALKRARGDARESAATSAAGRPVPTEIQPAAEGDAAELTELRDFFENGAMCLHWVAADGTILRANKAELTFLGYEAHDYIGHRIHEFHTDQGVIADMLDRLSRGETLVNYEARMRCRDGSVRDVLIDSSARFDDTGNFIHTRCFTR